MRLLLSESFSKPAGLFVIVVSAILLTSAGVQGARKGLAATPEGWLYGQPSFQVPRNYGHHFQMGREYEREGDNEAAAREYLTCIQLLQRQMPQRGRGGDSFSRNGVGGGTIARLADACLSLGSRLRKLGKLDLAIELYQGAVNIAPHPAALHEALGSALIEKGERRHRQRVETHRGLGAVQVGDAEAELYRLGVSHLYVARGLRPEKASVRIALSKGLRLWGLYEEALVEARRAAELDVDADNAKALLNQGLAAVASGNAGVAVSSLQSALEVPDIDEYSNEFRARIHNALGQALSATEQEEEETALEHYKQATELVPTNAAYQNNLGVAMRSDGDAVDAVDKHRKAAALEPDTVEYYLNIASASMDAADYSEDVADPATVKKHLNNAIEAYRRALRLNDEDVRIHHRLGLALQKRSSLSRLMNGYSNLNATALTDDNVRHAIGAIALHALSEARISWIDAMDARAYEFIPRLSLKPNRWPGLKKELRAQADLLDKYPLYGRTRLQLQEAITDFDTLSAVVLPAAGRLWELLNVGTSGGQAIIPAQMPGRLMTIAKEDSALGRSINGLTPKMRKVAVATGRILRAADSMDEAIAELRWAARLAPKDAQIKLSLGRALLAGRKNNAALQVLRKATVQDKTLVAAHYYGGIALARMGELSRAEDGWRRALDLQGDDVRVLLSLALLRLRQTEFSRARALLKRILGQQQEHAAAHYYLGLLNAVSSYGSPVTANLLQNARLQTPLHRKHYRVRGEFIEMDALQPTMDELMQADRIDPMREEYYQYVGVEFALTDPQPVQAEGFDVIHSPRQPRKLTPDWMVVNNNIAVCAALRGDLEKARELLDVAISCNPEYALAHWNMGRVLSLQDKKRAADEQFQKAAQLARRHRRSFFTMIKDMLQPGYPKKIGKRKVRGKPAAPKEEAVTEKKAAPVPEIPAGPGGESLPEAFMWYRYEVGRSD